MPEVGIPPPRDLDNPHVMVACINNFRYQYFNVLYVESPNQISSLSDDFNLYIRKQGMQFDPRSQSEPLFKNYILLHVSCTI